MVKAIVWGTGLLANNFMRLRIYNNNVYEVLYFVDNDCSKQGKSFYGKKVISPKEIKNIDYEVIIVCVRKGDEIVNQLTHDMGIGINNIITFNDIENRIVASIIEKYKDTKDIEIQKILKYYRNNGFNIYGDYFVPKEKRIIYRVNYDNDDWPFVWFEGKKMYFPKDYVFMIDEIGKYTDNILGEQGKNSPHLYIRENVEDIKEGSVIVDAGVCEGNFALRYVDRAKKIYLIESDNRWIEPLKRTFYDYKDKIILINKFLDGYDSSDTVTLDNIIKDKIDFLKMDIEGAEVKALLGAKEILIRSKARCSICSYHRQNDEKYIRHILKSYGYSTDVSNGYMFFIGDNVIADSMDFRRGIVYGWNTINSEGKTYDLFD